MNRRGKRIASIVFLFLLIGVLTEAAPTVLSFSYLRDTYKRDVSLTMIPSPPMSQEQRIVRHFEPYMGMKLDIKWQWKNMNDMDWPTFFASGDWPDAFYFWDDNAVKKLGDQGLLVNIMDYPKSLPYYSKFLNQNANLSRVSGNNKAVYSFCFGFFQDASTTNTTQFNWVWRMDIFKKYNLKIPTTLDEVYTVSKQLKNLFPKSYPIGGWSGGLNVVDVLLGINKAQKDIYYNGKNYVYGPIEDEAKLKRVLQYMNKLYAEGLLDPEWATATWDIQQVKMLNGTFFMVTNAWSDMNVLNMNPKFPGLEWGHAPKPVGFDGTSGWSYWLNPEGAGLEGYGVAINKKAKAPIDLMVKFFDYFYSPEIREMLDYGDEGVDFTKDSKGNITVFPETLPQGVAFNWNERRNMTWFDCGLNDLWGVIDHFVAKPVPCYLNGQWFNDNYIGFTRKMKYTDKDWVPDDRYRSPQVINTQADRDMWSKEVVPLETYVDESIVKFINGSKSFNEWGAFISDLKSKKYGDYQKVINVMTANRKKWE